MEERLGELQAEYARLCAALGEKIIKLELEKRNIVSQIEKLQEQHKAIFNAIEKKKETERKKLEEENLKKKPEEPKEEGSEAVNVNQD